MVTEDRLLRLEEVATRLGLSYHKTRKLVLRDKAMPITRIGSRGVRVKESDFNAYLKAKATSEAEAPPGHEPYEGRRDMTNGAVKSEPPSS